MQKIKNLSLIIMLSILLSGCALAPTGQKIEAKEITLKFWGVFDSNDAYKEIIDTYQMARPNIKIEYKKLRWDEYEDEMLNAWAEGTGPDIFLMHNSWLGKYLSKVEPMPSKLQIPILVKSGGGFNSKTETVLKKINTPTLEQIKSGFVNTVYEDAVRANAVYGLPLSVDSLALFYNRTILDAAGVVEVPKTWQEVADATKLITRQDGEGNITRSAIAMGGAANIFRSVDILSLLMMQNGTQMMNGNQVAFDQPSAVDRKYYPGVRALEFYTDFALPLKEVYTWNSQLPEATDAFLQGRLAMMFDFAYQLPYLKAQGKNIDFGVSGVPHINADGTDATLGQGVNLASYWLLTTAKQSEYKQQAWDFILFATTNNFQDEKGETIYQAEKYLNKTSKPPALRKLLSKYRAVAEMQPFVDQALTAKSWYHGNDSTAMEAAFRQMIADVVSGKRQAADAISFAAKLVKNSY